MLHDIPVNNFITIGRGEAALIVKCRILGKVVCHDSFEVDSCSGCEVDLAEKCVGGSVVNIE